MGLIIIETFVGEGSNEIAKLCRENSSALIIVYHSLNNEFQLLSITVNKPAKSLIKKKHNMWYVEQVTNQLNKGKDPADAEVSLHLSSQVTTHQGDLWDVQRPAKT